MPQILPIETSHKLALNTRKIFYFLVGCTFILVGMGVLTQTIKYTLGYNRLWGVIALFDLANEVSIPTFFSSVILLFAGILLLAIGILTRSGPGNYRGHWLSLAFIFIFLSFDEASSIHELYVYPLNALGISGVSSGVFGYAWVLVGIILVGIIVASFFKFWINMLPRTRRLTLISAVCFVAGAIGFEVVGGHFDQNGNRLSLTYSLLVAIEEMLEMLGVTFFIYALLICISEKFEIISIQTDD